MVKRFISLVACVACLVTLAGCGPEKVSHDMAEYILETPYQDDYRILQLTDPHIANKDNRKLQYEFLDLTISEAEADMIIVTGDLFTFADKTVAKEFFAFLDSYGVPWMVTFGNHDEQCYFSVDWMTSVLNDFGSHCLFKDLQDDDVFGNCNYAVNLMENGEPVYQLILMDSNRYNYGEYWGYDYIKQDQIDWYERLVNYTTDQWNRVVPSIAFFHIPLPEFNDAWEAAEQNSEDAVWEAGEKNESCSVPEYNSGLFDKILELGSTQSICVGHDHTNNFRIQYKGVDLCYGVNSTDRIYCQEGMMGGQVITIHSDGTLDYEHILHSYEEVQ